MLKKIYNYSFGYVVSILAGMCIAPIAAWNFQKESVAIYYTFLSIINFSSLFFTFGLDQIYLQKSQIIKSSEIFFRHSLKLIFLSIILIFIPLGIYYYPEILENNYFNTTEYIIFVFILYSVASQRLLFSKYKIDGGGDLISQQMSIQKIILLISISIFLIIEYDVKDVLLLALAFSYVPTIYIVCKEYSFVGMNAKEKIRTKNFCFFLFEGLVLVTGSLIFAAINVFDRWLIERYLGLDVLAIYSVGASVANIGFSIAAIILSMWLPNIYKQNSNINIIVYRYSKIITSVGLVVVGLSGFVARGVAYLLPDTYMGIENILPGLFVVPYVYLISEIYNPVLVANRKTHIIVYISGATFLFSVVFGFVFIEYLGLNGSIVAQTLSITFFAVVKIWLAGEYGLNIKLLSSALKLIIVVLLTVMPLFFVINKLFLFSMWVICIISGVIKIRSINAL